MDTHGDTRPAQALRFALAGAAGVALGLSGLPAPAWVSLADEAAQVAGSWAPDGFGQLAGLVAALAGACCALVVALAAAAPLPRAVHTAALVAAALAGTLGGAPAWAAAAVLVVAVVWLPATLRRDVVSLVVASSVALVREATGLAGRWTLGDVPVVGPVAPAVLSLTVVLAAVAAVAVTWRRWASVGAEEIL